MGSKVIPTPDILARAYQRAVRTKAINARLAELQADITRQPTVILTNLPARVSDVLREHPELSWDATLWKIVQRSGGH